MFKQFEEVFRWSDYIFKFVGWNVLMGLLIYVGKDHHQQSLVIIGNSLTFVSSATFAAFIGALIESAVLRIFQSRKAGAAVFAAIWLMILGPLIYIQVHFLEDMTSLAKRNTINPVCAVPHQALPR